MQKLKRFTAREKIRFPMLADPKSRIIGAFGLIDKSAPADSSWSGFAHPIIFVVDRGGIVQHRFSERNYQNRPAIDVILDVLRKEATN